MKILIVDDALYMRMTYKKIFANTDAQIVGEAENGFEAIAKYQETKPDYVILDLTMPGISGQDVLKEIIGIDPEAKVVIVSAMGQEVFIKNCLKLGAKYFIIKPFKEKAILSLLGLSKKE